MVSIATAVESANGQRIPHPLRLPTATGESSPVVAQSKNGTQSILSCWSSPRVERLYRQNSLEDGYTSEESDGNEVPPMIFITRKPSRRGFGQKSVTTTSKPIIKNYENKNRARKTVRFADDVGLDLTRTCEFAEMEDDGYCGSGAEPRVDLFDSSAKPQNADNMVVEISEWQVNFSQPAADYIAFREKLDSNDVALENVIIKQKSESFLGTIKVKNVFFKKDVIVRCTFNVWQTYSDFPAKYCSSNTDLYDTFSFEISIPEEAKQRNLIEFCVALRTDGREYWDSNQGKNYQLIAGHTKREGALNKSTDAYRIETHSKCWGEFASWNQLENHQPYW
ncbi:protein phosphatase 1 regulatory subunit 3B-B-like isoform X2 [Paramacrobiotus metropolitanus]|uniref:protein phosphatase 1 regulatory subunit 3B-B-like isoform X2 n=1 Tax=Paramacrobiotus metropolitanus TaxID=2943436 RepID=UPI00244602A4|nr:protein phosphatase 1 regulatory subunit 3B-B-like isoform X2 [Paramacrobiotus metropolitanus]